MSDDKVLRATVDVTEALSKYPDRLLDKDRVRGIVEQKKEKARADLVREKAYERLDRDEIRDADRLLWVDECEVYPLCEACYQENQNSEWTGSSSREDYEAFRQKMRQKVRDGTACDFCRHMAVTKEISEIHDEFEIEIEVEGRR